MSEVPRVRLSGPLERYAVGFGAELLRRGYSRFTTRLHLQLLANLSRWLEAEGCDAGDVTPELGGALRVDSPGGRLPASAFDAGVGAAAWVRAQVGCGTSACGGFTNVAARGAA